MPREPDSDTEELSSDDSQDDGYQAIPESSDESDENNESNIAVDDEPDHSSQEEGEANIDETPPAQEEENAANNLEEESEEESEEDVFTLQKQIINEHSPFIFDESDSVSLNPAFSSELETLYKLYRIVDDNDPDGKTIKRAIGAFMWLKINLDQMVRCCDNFRNTNAIYEDIATLGDEEGMPIHLNDIRDSQAHKELMQKNLQELEESIHYLESMGCLPDAAGTLTVGCCLESYSRAILDYAMIKRDHTPTLEALLSSTLEPYDIETNSEDAFFALSRQIGKAIWEKKPDPDNSEVKRYYDSRLTLKHISDVLLAMGCAQGKLDHFLQSTLDILQKVEEFRLLFLHPIQKSLVYTEQLIVSLQIDSSYLELICRYLFPDEIDLVTFALARNSNWELIPSLIDSYPEPVDFSFRDSVFGETLLHRAVTKLSALRDQPDNPHREQQIHLIQTRVEEAVAAGADPFAQNEAGESALDDAMASLQVELAITLLSNTEENKKGEYVEKVFLNFANKLAFREQEEISTHASRLLNLLVNNFILCQLFETQSRLLDYATINDFLEKLISHALLDHIADFLKNMRGIQVWEMRHDHNTNLWHDLVRRRFSDENRAKVVTIYRNLLAIDLSRQQEFLYTFTQVLDDSDGGIFLDKLFSANFALATFFIERADPKNLAIAANSLTPENLKTFFLFVDFRVWTWEDLQTALLEANNETVFHFIAINGTGDTLPTTEEAVAVKLNTLLSHYTQEKNWDKVGMLLNSPYDIRFTDTQIFSQIYQQKRLFLILPCLNKLQGPSIDNPDLLMSLTLLLCCDYHKIPLTPDYVKSFLENHMFTLLASNKYPEILGLIKEMRRQLASYGDKISQQKRLIIENVERILLTSLLASPLFNLPPENIRDITTSLINEVLQNKISLSLFSLSILLDCALISHLQENIPLLVERIKMTRDIERASFENLVGSGYYFLKTNPAIFLTDGFPPFARNALGHCRHLPFQAIRFVIVCLVRDLCAALEKASPFFFPFFSRSYSKISASYLALADALEKTEDATQALAICKNADSSNETQSPNLLAILVPFLESLQIAASPTASASEKSDTESDDHLGSSSELSM